MQRLESAAEVAAACDDVLVRWAAQALEPGYPSPRGAAWALGGAVAVHTPALNRRDRLVLAGAPDGALELLHALLPSLPDSVRPLLHEPVARRADIGRPVTFGWMQRASTVDIAELSEVDGYRLDWVHDPATVDELLDAANPRSWVRPRLPGAQRWLGAFTADGTLASVAAQAWSAPTVAFLAGVATATAHRGRGLSTAVCGRLTALLAARLPDVALMVDAGNAQAIHVYRTLGFDYLPVTALIRP